jgi:hypothetical protein
MLPEIRNLALEHAIAVYRDYESVPSATEVIDMADRFAAFLAGDTSAESPKPAAGRKSTKATEQTQPADKPPAESTSPSTSIAAQQPAASTAPTVTPDAITKVIIALCAKDKSACLKVLEGFGVKRGGELKPEQLADAHKKLSEKLAELTK